MTRINFFTPTFFKTGSEVALSNLIKLSTDSFEMKVVSNFKGELRTELPANVSFYDMGSHHAILPNSKNKYVKLINKALGYLKSDQKYLRRFNKKYPADLWYVNTISLPSVVTFAMENKIPLVLHIHELEQMFVGLSAKQLKNIVDYPFLIIACSRTCAEVVRLSGRKNNIEVCYPGINFKNINADSQKSLLIRRKYHIDDDAFLWVMNGTMDINKDPSLFVEIADYILKKNYKAHFMWLTNGTENNGYVAYCMTKAVELGISDKIIWTPKLNNDYYDHFNACNGFVLTSSKESFSMVTVEALYMSKPVVSFDCGGVKEIVNETNGVIVKCKNIEAIGDAMIKIMNKEYTFDLFLLKKSVEKFDINKQQQNWKHIISEGVSKF